MGNDDRLKYGSIQSFGLALLTAAMSTVIAVIAVLGDTDEIGMFAIVALVSLVVTVVTLRFDTRWAKAVGLLGSLLIFGSVFFLAFGVMHIFSPLEFVVGLALLVGFLLSLVGGVMALISAMKDRRGQSASEARLRLVVSSAIGVLAVVSVVGFFVTRESVSEAEAASATPLDMANFEFAPEQVETDGKLFIHNSDPFAHDLTIEELDVYAYVGPGSDAIVDLTAYAGGTYEFVCSLHTDPSTGEGMTGVVTVTG